MVIKSIVKVLFPIVCFVVLLSCSNNRNENIMVHSNVKTIEITDNIDESLPWDSLIAEIKIVPLETNKNCLIGEVSRISNLNDKFYIQDKKNKVLIVFNEKGKFLFKIDKKGKANGEYLELRDFKVDKKGDIYLLDFNKIIQYSSTGDYISTISLNRLQGNVKYDFLSPLEFAIGEHDEFYLYNGSMGIQNSLKNQYAIYKINSKGIIGRYLPIKRQVFNYQNQFYEYHSVYNLQPILGNDTIYSISKGQLHASYYVDFGKRKLIDEELPILRRGLGKHIISSGKSRDLCWGISNIIETDDVIAFEFWNKGLLHYVFNSKINNNQIIGKQHFCKRIRPSSFNCTYDNYLVSVMEPYILKSMNNDISPGDYKNMSDMDKSIINQINDMDNLSNPALLFIKLKPF